MIDKMKLLLHDQKEDLSLLVSEGNSVNLIMKFFSNNNQTIGDLENPKSNQHIVKIYKALGWQAEEHFDVISSFWTVFACAVIIEVQGNKEYVCSRKFFNFPDYKKYFMPWIPGGKYGYEKNGKWHDSFPQKYLNPEKFSRIMEIVNSTICSYPGLNELAMLTHSAANFMPCPPSPYNAAKGSVMKIHDFFPLFIDFIDVHCVEKSSVQIYATKPEDSDLGTIESKTLKYWKEWFISNRTKYCFEDYYYIYTDENKIVHIKGIPFFKAQSLSHPLPCEEGEIKECLDEMVKRIYVRAYRLSSLMP